jgi:adenylate cyclase
MEIEKKYMVKVIPDNLDQYEKREIEQGYLCKNPVVRIRKSNTDYVLTYKSRFGLDETMVKDVRVCNEVEVPLNEGGYNHLKKKIDDNLISKTRYIIPLDNGLKAEIDIFHGYLDGLIFLEVEFQTENMAKDFEAPDWFGEDVSSDYRYSNSFLSTVNS